MDAPLFDQAKDFDNNSLSERLRFLEDLKTSGIMSVLRFDSDKTRVCAKFCNTKALHALKTEGKIFELIVYHELRNTGLFDDIRTGVDILWKETSHGFEKQLKERLDWRCLRGRNSLGGYILYEQERNSLSKEIARFQTDNIIRNELDVIAIKGMTPLFISCKTSEKEKKEWIYEISSLARYFNAIPVMALSKDISKSKIRPFAERAQQMGVSLIGLETITNEAKLRQAIATLLCGDTYSPFPFKLTDN